MNELLPLLLASGLSAAVVAAALVPVVVWMAERRGQREPSVERGIPRLGGVALFAAVAVAGVLGLAARWEHWTAIVPRSELLALAWGTGLVFLVGVADDLVGTSPWQKLLAQVLAAWMIVGVGWSFEAVRIPILGTIELGVWGPIVSIVWIVGVTNALNLLDGLDGLAGGVAAIISLSLVAWALALGNHGTAILFAAVAGACLGFLWHNWEPARIYLGDSGSLTLGFLFGAVSLHSALKAPAAVAILVPILALGLPVIDTLLVMVFRFAQGSGRGAVRRTARIFRADRSHLHHLLGHVVVRRGRIVAILYVLALVFCAGAVAVAMTGELAYGLALLFFEIACVLAMRRLGLSAEARKLAFAQREEARRVLERWPKPPASVPPAVADVLPEPDLIPER